MTLLTILLQQQGQGAGWSSIIMMVASEKKAKRDS